MASPKPVVVSLKDLEADAVPLALLEEAFGPSSLGILIVKDLPPKYPDLRKQLLSYSSYLANLPKHELDKLESPESKYLTGWSLGKESLKPGIPDTLKGSYYVNCSSYVSPSLSASTTTSPDGRKDFSDFPEHTTPQLWPSEELLPGFRAATEELCGLIIDTAALVARACDRFAVENVPQYEKGYMERMVKTSLSTKARLLHYFPPPPPSQHTNGDGNADTKPATDQDDWCATHVDHGCLTGLTSAMYIDESAHLPDRNAVDASTSALPPLAELSAPPDPATGLYIHDRSGRATKVAIPRDCLAFQTGEALEVMTKGRFRAVPHFVRGAEAGLGGARVGRNTLAVFTQPNLWEAVDVEGGVDFAAFSRGVTGRHY